MNHKEITKGLTVMAVIFEEFVSMLGTQAAAGVLNQLMYFENIGKKKTFNGQEYFHCTQYEIMPDMHERVYRRHLKHIESLGYIDRKSSSIGTYILIHYNKIEQFLNDGSGINRGSTNVSGSKTPKVSSKDYTDLIGLAGWILGINPDPIRTNSPPVWTESSACTDKLSGHYIYNNILISCIHGERVLSELENEKVGFVAWQKLYRLLFCCSAPTAKLTVPFRSLSSTKIDQLVVYTILMAAELWSERLYNFPNKNSRYAATVMTAFRKTTDWEAFVFEFKDDLIQYRENLADGLNPEALKNFERWFNSVRNQEIIEPLNLKVFYEKNRCTKNNRESKQSGLSKLEEFAREQGVIT